MLGNPLVSAMRDWWRTPVSSQGFFRPWGTCQIADLSQLDDPRTLGVLWYAPEVTNRELDAPWVPRRPGHVWILLRPERLGPPCFRLSIQLATFLAANKPGTFSCFLMLTNPR